MIPVSRLCSACIKLKGTYNVAVSTYVELAATSGVEFGVLVGSDEGGDRLDVLTTGVPLSFIWWQTLSSQGGRGIWNVSESFGVGASFSVLLDIFEVISTGVNHDGRWR